MQLDILTPEQKIFSGEVDVVSLPGESGSFSLMSGHAPIVAALKDGTIELSLASGESINLDDYAGKLYSADGKYKVNIKSGFVECLNDKISVLIEGASTN